MRWAVACVALCACGRIGFDIGDRDASAADATDAPGVCASWSAWSTPTRVSVINSTSVDWSPAISDDSLYLVFGSDRLSGTELFSTQRQSLDDDWDPPAHITELASGSDEEDDATLSADLREMFFGNTLIFRTTREDLESTWQPRQVVVPNDFDFVQGAELSRDDLRLYFSAGSPIEDLYVMERPDPSAAFGPYTRIMPDPDPNGDTGFPTLSADELELYVSSDHGGERDIYSSRRESRTEPFPAVARDPDLSESGADEWDPELSFDGTTLWLSSNRAGSQGFDIYVATRTCND